MATFEFPNADLPRVAVLLGGDSAERAVSLESGAAVVRALRERNYRVTPIDPAFVDLSSFGWSEFDVVFLALHGQNGEDGTVQELLESAEIPYTGSDAYSSRLAFSKSASKERFVQSRVPTPDYVLIHETDEIARVEQHAQRLGFPVVIKPDSQGSSLGISIVHSANELQKALELCFRFDSFGILEKAVIGTEWTVGLLDNQTLPLLRIETDRPFFDYQAKYEDDNTAYCFDVALPGDVIESIESACRNAARSLKTRGLARVDVLLDKQNQPWVLEVNTIPGLTDHSLIPKAAARIGIEFPELCERAIQSCFAAASERSHRLA